MIVIAVLNGWTYLGYVCNKFSVAIFAGQLELSWAPGDYGIPYNWANREGWGVSIGPNFTYRLWFENFSDEHRFLVYIPLWFLILVPWAGMTLFNRQVAKRRRMRGLCVRCGYDRSGLTQDAVCPECGFAPRPA